MPTPRRLLLASLVVVGCAAGTPAGVFGGDGPAPAGPAAKPPSFTESTWLAKGYTARIFPTMPAGVTTARGKFICAVRELTWTSAEGPGPGEYASATAPSTAAPSAS